MILFSNIIIFALLLIFSFIIGFFTLPVICDRLLKHKRQEITESFERNLASYKYVQENKPHVPEKRITAVSKWAEIQVNQNKMGKLEPWMANKLAESGIIDRVFDEEHYVKIDTDKWSFDATHIDKFLCGLLCFFSAFVINLPVLLCPYFSVASHQGLACLFATLLMLCIVLIVLCDKRVMIIPYQVCLASIPLSILCAFINVGFEGIFSSIITTLVITGLLYSISLIFSIFGIKGSIGAGDIRIIPWICLACGMTGSIAGLIACFVFLALQAIFLLIRKKGNRKTYLPMAPGLLIWLIVGYFAGFFIGAPFYIALY